MITQAQMRRLAALEHRQRPVARRSAPLPPPDTATLRTVLRMLVESEVLATPPGRDALADAVRALLATVDISDLEDSEETKEAV